MKQIKLKRKFRQAKASSLQRSRMGRLIRKLLGRVDVLTSNALLIVLVCLVTIRVCCAGSGESNQLELTGVNQVASDERNNPYDKQSLFILLSVLKEFCSNNPLECPPDHTTDCSISGGRLVCNHIASITPNTRQSPEATNGGDNNGGEQQRADSELSRANRSTSFSLDEPIDGQFWLPKLASVVGERDVDLWTDQTAQAIEAKERILNMLARYATLEAATDITVTSSQARNKAGRTKPVKDKFKRDQEQHLNKAAGGRGHATKANTYRVTLDQANRLIRAHRRQRNGFLTPLTGPIMLATSPNGRLSVIGGGGGSSGGGGGGGDGDLLIVPKRTDFVSLSSDEIRPESGIRRATGHENSAAISTKTSGHQLAPLDELGLKLAFSKPPDSAEASNNEEALKCNMRRFIYRATKTDRLGNQCTGLITASICYGACDTGEIADWLFPYKKSIHKVCRHGARVRRETRLTDCTTSSGVALPLDDDDELDNLTRYHYVDALNCVCKRCTSADTTCLGTMSTPHLQTLGEIGELAPANHNHKRHHQQQQPTASSGDD